MWFLLICLTVLIAYIRNKYKYRDIEKLPGPPLKWISGNATEFGSTIEDLFLACGRIIKQYGGIVKVWLGPFRLALFVTDLDMVEFFLSSNVHLKKSKGYDTFKIWLGDGLINSEGGNTWMKHRKILTPAFHFKILEQFAEVFHRNLQTLVEIFKKEQGAVVDVYEPVRLYAMDAICETSMGITSNCQTHGENAYLKSTQAFLDIYLRRFFSFLKMYDFIFQFTRDYKDLHKHAKAMSTITEEIIKKRKQDKYLNSDDDTTDLTGIKKKKVLMDILLDYPQLTDEEIRHEVDTFLFAGHDTVSSTMAFGLYELAKHQGVQEKILEEIHDIVGQDRNQEIQLSELKQMSYLDRVLKEVLRLYPVAPLYERELKQDVVYKGMNIPAYTTISFHPYWQHRNPELFPNPEVFDPDRFLPENTVKRHPFAYIPFSAGARNCIGQKYATMNVKTLLANVIRHFELRPADFPHIPKLANNAVLTSLNGLPIRLIHRK